MEWASERATEVAAAAAAGRAGSWEVACFAWLALGLGLVCARCPMRSLGLAGCGSTWLEPQQRVVQSSAAAPCLTATSPAPPCPAPPQLLLHYNRFLELCKRQGAEGLAVARTAVTMPAVMHGLKQYSGV